MIFKSEFSKYFYNLNQFSLYNTNINDVLSLKYLNFVVKILQNEKIINIENHLKNMKKYMNRNENSSLNRTLIK